MKKALIIVAHADDAELSMGGTLARLAKKNYHVFILNTTTSDYTDYSGKILRTKKEVNIENLNSLHTLGVNRYCFLNFETKKFPYNNESIEQINKIIDEYNPDLIFTHHIEDRHQDHTNTAKAVLSAARYYNNVLMFEPMYPSNTHLSFQPNLYIDITGYMFRKLNALKYHKSQYNKYSYWKDLVLSLGRIRGIEIGSKYAEAFSVLKLKLEL